MSHPSDACVDHVAQLYALAMRLARDSAAAEDLVQETMANAIEHWDQYDPDRNLRSWLYGILTNTFITECRKRTRRRAALEHPLDARLHCCAPAIKTPHEHVTANELCDEILNVLDRLDPEYRQVVENVHVSGQTYQEAASALQIPAGTVMSRLHRARRVLRVALVELARDEWGIG